MINPIATPIKPTLFHSQFWASSKPAYVLKALGLTGQDGPLSISVVSEKQVKEDPVLTELNPQKRLPFFYDPSKDLKLNESSGLVEYLLETYDTTNKLWPAPGEPTRPEFLKLIHFGPATAYHIDVPILFPSENVEEKKKEWHNIVAPTYEQALDKFGGPFLLGEKFSAADIVIGYSVMTISSATCGEEILKKHPKIQAYLNHISQCPIYKELYGSPTVSPSPEPKKDAGNMGKEEFADPPQDSSKRAKLE